MGFSSRRLRRGRQVLAGHVERGAVAGAVALVSRRGETIVETVGDRVLGGPPMTRDTLFRITSMTKPIAAVATMAMVEECRLRLDEPVDRFLPELAGRRVLRELDGQLDDTVPASRPITTRDLLTLTLGSGIVLAPPNAYPIQRALAQRQLGIGPPTPQVPPRPDEWLRQFAELPLMHQPGAGWMYETGFAVLGVLLERASGQPLDVLFRERIFEPLGMVDTAFSVPAGKLDRFAACYQVDEDSGSLELYDGADDSAWASPPAFRSAANGLVSTVDDYLAFASRLLAWGRPGAAGDHRVLSRLAVEAMTTPQLTPAQSAMAARFLGPNRGWGFGVSVVTARDDVASVPGRYGWDGGLGTSWTNDPAEDLVVVLMTQRLATPDLPVVQLDFLTSTYQAIDD